MASFACYPYTKDKTKAIVNTYLSDEEADKLRSMGDLFKTYSKIISDNKATISILVHPEGQYISRSGQTTNPWRINQSPEDSKGNQTFGKSKALSEPQWNGNGVVFEVPLQPYTPYGPRPRKGKTSKVHVMNPPAKQPSLQQLGDAIKLINQAKDFCGSDLVLEITPEGKIKGMIVKELG